MTSMWDAVSDFDYYDQFLPPQDEENEESEESE